MANRQLNTNDGSVVELLTVPSEHVSTLSQQWLQFSTGGSRLRAMRLVAMIPTRPT